MQRSCGAKDNRKLDRELNLRSVFTLSQLANRSKHRRLLSEVRVYLGEVGFGFLVIACLPGFSFRFLRRRLINIVGTNSRIRQQRDGGGLYF